jgi:two-component system sensor histidine kinase/response regulator
MSHNRGQSMSFPPRQSRQSFIAPATRRRHFLVALGAGVLATTLLVVWLNWQIGGETVALYVSDAATVGASFLACLTCFRAGRHHEARYRMSWWLLAAACGAWMVGEVIWTAYDVAGTGGPPIPSWADVGYLLFIPLAVGALLSHPGLRGSGMRKARAVVDSLSIAVALLFLSWTSVLGPLWRDSDLTTIGGVVTLAYPVGDVIIGFFVLLALRRMGAAERLGLTCLLAGLIALVIADSAFAYVVTVKEYTTGHLLDAGWFAGFLGIALGAFASDGRVQPARAAATWASLPSRVAPLLPMLIALAVAGISINLGYRPDRVAAAMVLTLILLAFIRQALLVLDVVTTGGDEKMLHRVARAALHNARVKEDGYTPTSVSTGGVS